MLNYVSISSLDEKSTRILISTETKENEILEKKQQVEGKGEKRAD